jgi:HAE1 family hydrophobic/amphiphilic exporter-1
MKAIGTAVTGGMLSATFIDLFYIPLLFVVVSRVFKREPSQEVTKRRPNSNTFPEPG